MTVDAAPTNMTAGGFKPPHFKTQKVVQDHFADPGILKVGDTWYAFATNNGKQNVRVATSTDFSSWTVMENWDALPRTGSWTAQPKMETENFLPTSGKFIDTIKDLVDGRWPWSNAPPAVWAPDVSTNDLGMHVLYYSAQQKGEKRHCVGAAVGATPQGPYQALDEPFACHEEQGGSIDPSGFHDTATGKRYVTYKIDGNNVGNGGLCGNMVAPQVPTPIMLQEVGPDGFTKIGDPVQILDRGVDDGPLVEAPNLVRTEDGKYVLFFSSNCYSTDLYDIGYAFADSVTGPYTKAGPFAITGTAGLKAPGGATVAPDGKHMVFHAADEKGGRSMYTTEVSFEFGMDKKMKVAAIAA
ncbi:putative glycosyl hydrolase family 43 protein [Neofusicoccum parvum]|uniref:Glycosyl hydrolase family 43 protein n=1 Tax=Neofusicoccum parvum TaxID=310453 RepID=A0ACB5RTP7_9PEZI|nr:putative glycosyl hydrolase family 43 protein [Neofusicoccum parvum]